MIIEPFTGVIRKRFIPCVEWILGASREFGVDPFLLSAIAWQESVFVPNTQRYEDSFYEKYVKKMAYLDLKKQYPKQKNNILDISLEKHGLATSWGFIQVMGQTARELGHRGPLPDLLGYTGVQYGCRYFNKKFTKYGQDFEMALSAYNAGSETEHNRESYVEPVMARWKILANDVEVKRCFGR